MPIVEIEGLPADTFSLDHGTATIVGDRPESPWGSPQDPWTTRRADISASDDADDEGDDDEGDDDDWDGEGDMPLPGAPVAPEELDDFDENDFDDDFDDDFEEELEDEYDMAELEEDVTEDDLVETDDDDLPIDVVDEEIKPRKKPNPGE